MPDDVRVAVRRDPRGVGTRLIAARVPGAAEPCAAGVAAARCRPEHVRAQSRRAFAGLLRRHRPADARAGGVVTLPGTIRDAAGRTTWLLLSPTGQRVQLWNAEARLLQCLIEQPREVVDRGTLLAAMGRPGLEAYERNSMSRSRACGARPSRPAARSCRSSRCAARATASRGMRASSLEPGEYQGIPLSARPRFSRGICGAHCKKK